MLSERQLFALFVASFLVLLFVVPAVRLRMTAGTWGFVLQRRANPYQRAIGLGMAALVGAIAAWALLFWARGPEALGVWPAPRWVRIAGWALLVFGALLTMLAQSNMGRSWRVGIDDRPTGLVTGGLFRAVRNPIFSAMGVTLAGAVLVAPSVWSVAGWVVYAGLVAIQVRLEEQHLLALHGEAYARYAARVGRFIPVLGRLEQKEMA